MGKRHIYVFEIMYSGSIDIHAVGGQDCVSCIWIIILHNICVQCDQPSAYNIWIYNNYYAKKAIRMNRLYNVSYVFCLGRIRTTERDYSVIMRRAPTYRFS